MKLKGEKSEAVSGIFRERSALEKVMHDLERHGLSNDVSIIMTDKTRDHLFPGGFHIGEPEGEFPGRTRGDLTAEGAGAGSLAGGVLGALIGGLTMVGSVLIPGAGLLVAGPLVGALTGGAIGAATGGLIGALVGAGVPEEEAQQYERILKEEGNILLVAHLRPDEVDEARGIFQRYGAQHLHVY